MREQLVRLIFLCVFIIIVTSDIRDMMNTSPTFSSMSSWFRKLDPTIQNRDKRSIIMSRSQRIERIQEGQEMKTKTEDPEAWRLEQATKIAIDSATNPIGLTDEEKQQLIALKARWTKVMQQYCLPKLVCELHAAVTDGVSVSDAERGLLSLIKDTSLGTAGEIVSRYHFAAHMGQLLSGVEGNGCHNFYPNCPISGTRVLQMVRVRV